MYQTLQRSSSNTPLLPKRAKGKSGGTSAPGAPGASPAANSPGSASAAAGEGAGDVAAPVDAQRGVMQELAGKSAFMKQVEADRQRMAPMITDLAVQITAFQPLDMVQVEVFVAEVERRLALLCDEGMVLKTFSSFPEKRLEAMREAVARKRELQKLTTTMDPHGHKWQARDSIALELHQVIDRFTEARPKVEWYMREAESIRKSLRAHAVPFDMDLVKGAQHAPLGLAKYGMRMLFTAHSRILQAPAADAAAALPTVKELIGDVLKFAFQCHQFAGGFDSEANDLFADLHAVLSPPQEQEEEHD